MAEPTYKPIESDKEACELLQYCIRYFTIFKEVLNHPCTPHHLNMMNQVQRYLCPDIDLNDLDREIQEREKAAKEKE